VGSPVWSPDSRSLFFESEERGEVPVFTVSIKGNDVRKVMDKNTNHDIQVAHDGKFVIMTHQSATRPAEIFSCRVDGGALRQITHVNDSVFEALDLPAPESVTYQGDGGTPIQAWLFKPPQFDPGKKYPLIMLVHGGPQNAWLDSWSYRWNPPLWAAQGYVIIAPNPRGSTGFGQDFVDQISRDWGGKVFEDLVKCLEYAQSLPYVDTSRTAAAGASFGGYMINWLQARIPERFRTLVCHDGTYNLVSSYGTTEEVWFDEWDHGGLPWEHPQEFEKFSPHRYAKNFRTPQLIIHGELDFRVPVSEGMQMFTALQRQGIPSKLVLFPDEGHWVLKPANSAFWHATVFDWLASYLK
jgi:dipeptidyl aminopeptidase/acylaminoacyl peptidase